MSDDEDGLGKPNKKSPKVTKGMAREMLKLLQKGYMQHDVAARFNVNQGRVSEVKNGHLFPDLSL